MIKLIFGSILVILLFIVVFKDGFKLCDLNFSILVLIIYNEWLGVVNLLKFKIL